MGLFRSLRAGTRFIIDSSTICMGSKVNSTVRMASLNALLIVSLRDPDSDIFSKFTHPFPKSHVGFSTTASNPPKNDCFVDSANDGYRKSSLVSVDIARDAERICGLLVANHPSSSVDSALDRSGIRLSQELAVEVLKKLSNAGVLALSFFRWASKREGFLRTTEVYHRLIGALGKIKQFRLIWDLVNDMSAGGVLIKDTFALISQRYVRAKRLKEAIETFEKMGKYGFTAELSDLNSLLDAICKSRNVQIAQQLVHDMKKRNRFKPNLKTYTILLEGWGQVMNISKLTSVYQEMMDDGFEPDQVAYGILVHAFCKCRKIDHALNIFHEMEARNLKPSPHVYCNLINGLGSKKRLDEALQFLEKFNDSGFPPELPTYNAAVGAYCWSEQYDRAYMMLDEMKRCGINPSTRTYDVILGHLIRDKRNTEAYRLFQRMEREDGCRPELNTYTMIVRMFCAGDDVDMAIRIWEQMNARGVLPCLHMFLVLINRLCYENRLPEACRFFEEMLDRGLRPSGTLYSNLIQALERGGRSDLAAEMGNKLNKARNTPLEG